MNTEKEKTLSPEDAYDAFVTYFEIMMDTFKLEGVSLTDLHHSALIWRLLDGKKPLPKPPPKQYSRPWYKVAEEGDFIRQWCREGDKLYINQGSGWTLIDARTLKHENGDTYVLNRDLDMSIEYRTVYYDNEPTLFLKRVEAE